MVTEESAGAADRMPAAASTSSAHDGPLILLVEDNPVNREVAVGMLESLGMQNQDGRQRLAGDRGDERLDL